MHIPKYSVKHLVRTKVAPLTRQIKNNGVAVGVANQISGVDSATSALLLDTPLVKMKQHLG